MLASSAVVPLMSNTTSQREKLVEFSRARALERLCDGGCGAPSELLCAGCRVASYCSEECQRARWPDHERSCACAPPSREARALLSSPHLPVILTQLVCLKQLAELLPEARQHNCVLLEPQPRGTRMNPDRGADPHRVVLAASLVTAPDLPPVAPDAIVVRVASGCELRYRYARLLSSDVEWLYERLCPSKEAFIEFCARPGERFGVAVHSETGSVRCCRC
jgi:MYND finger